jgi:hypothetical protein
MRIDHSGKHEAVVQYVLADLCNIIDWNTKEKALSRHECAVRFAQL